MKGSVRFEGLVRRNGLGTRKALVSTEDLGHAMGRGPMSGSRRMTRLRFLNRWLFDEEGSATAELAVVLPTVVIVLALCLGSVVASAQYVRLVDATADAARSAARKDDPRSPIARVQPAAAVSSSEEGRLVCVEVAAELRPLPALVLPVAVRSCALGGGG